MRRFLRIIRVFLVILLSPILALVILVRWAGGRYGRLRQRVSGWLSKGRTRRALALLEERAGFDPLGEPLHWAYALHYQFAPDLLRLGRRLEDEGYTVLSLTMPETRPGFELRVGHHRHHTLPSLMASLREVLNAADSLKATAEHWDVAREEDTELWRIPGSYAAPLEVTAHERLSGSSAITIAALVPGIDRPQGRYRDDRGHTLTTGAELAEEVLREMAIVQLNPAEPVWLHCYLSFRNKADAEAVKAELDAHEEARMESTVEEIAEKESYVVAAVCRMTATDESLTALGDWLADEAATHAGHFNGWELNLKVTAESTEIAFKKLMERSEQNRPDREMGPAEIIVAASEAGRMMLLPLGPAATMNHLGCLGGPLLLMTGFTLLEKGHPREAARMAHQLIQLGMRYEGALHLLGHASIALKDYATAAGAFTQAAAGEPDNAGVHINLGGVLEKLQRHDEAAEHYLRAQQIQSLNPAAWLQLARVYARMDRRDDVLNALRQGLRQDATHLATARTDDDIAAILTAEDLEALAAEEREWSRKAKELVGS